MSAWSLGDRLSCILTGFSGVAIARIEYLNGCIQWQLQPEMLVKGPDCGRNQGAKADPVWFDEQQLRTSGVLSAPTSSSRAPTAVRRAALRAASGCGADVAADKKPLKPATFRRVPPPEPIDGPASQVGKIIKRGSKTYVVAPKKEHKALSPEEKAAQLAHRRAPKGKLRMKPAQLEPPLRPVKKLERDKWRRAARLASADGKMHDKPADFTNLHLLRLLALVDAREEDIRDLTGRLA